VETRGNAEVLSNGRTQCHQAML